MNRCRVEKRIYPDVEKRAEYTCLFYELPVEEKPERGQQLHEDRWFSGPLTFVVWNVDKERFDCRVDDEVPCTDGAYDYSHEFLVENALLEGWTICEERYAA